MKPQDKNTIDSAPILITKMQLTFKNNLRGFYLLLPVLIFMSVVGIQLHQTITFPTWIIISWWIMIGIQIGWILGIFALLKVSQFYSKKL